MSGKRSVRKDAVTPLEPTVKVLQSKLASDKRSVRKDAVAPLEPTVKVF
ncbi:MAG: hypothetical protein IJR40_06260 [Treponema sp.]|nr:hypothetical protein [Treponema sp.]